MESCLRVEKSSNSSRRRPTFSSSSRSTRSISTRLTLFVLLLLSFPSRGFIADFFGFVLVWGIQEQIKAGLATAGVVLEDLGGDVPSVEVSGLTGLGLDSLMETVSTLAEVAELRAEVDMPAEGYVLESQIERGRGFVSFSILSLSLDASLSRFLLLPRADLFPSLFFLLDSSLPQNRRHLPHRPRNSQTRSPPHRRNLNLQSPFPHRRQRQNRQIRSPRFPRRRCRMEGSPLRRR